MRSIPFDWLLCLQISFILSIPHPSIYLLSYVFIYPSSLSLCLSPLPHHLFVEGISCLLTVSHIWRWLTSSPRLSLRCSSVSCSSCQLVESSSLIRFRFEFWARLLHGWGHGLSSGGSACLSLCDARPSFCNVSTSGCPVHSWWVGVQWWVFECIIPSTFLSWYKSTSRNVRSSTIWLPPGTIYTWKVELIIIISFSLGA